MLIGILSDTHDKADIARRAIELLQSRGARFFIHCGDVGDPQVLDHLAGLPSAVVWGNCDWDRTGLQRYAEGIGVPVYGAQAHLTLDGKQIAVVHGDDVRLKQRLLEEQAYDYLLQGHTHVRSDTRVGRTRVINPGALHRANPKTVALLETGVDEVEFIELE